jgi:hypothetical protein
MWNLFIAHGDVAGLVREKNWGNVDTYIYIRYRSGKEYSRTLNFKALIFCFQLRWGSACILYTLFYFVKYSVVPAMVSIYTLFIWLYTLHDSLMYIVLSIVNIPFISTLICQLENKYICQIIIINFVKIIINFQIRQTNLSNFATPTFRADTISNSQIMISLWINGFWTRIFTGYRL